MHNTSTRVSSRTIVLGASESGKSYWSKRQVDNLGDELVLVWDPQHEWAGQDATDGIKGAHTFPGMAELCRWIQQNNPRERGARLVVQSARTADFAAFCKLAYTAQNCWAVVDEAHAWMRANELPEEARYLVQVSRHRRVSLLLVAQRPTGLAPDVRDNKARVVLFHMPGQASLAWVRGEFGKEAEESVRKLPPRCYLDLDAITTGPAGPKPTRDATG